MVRLSNSSPSNISEIPGELYVLPTKDSVIFPAMVLPIFLTREDDIAVINKAMLGDHMVVMVAQKDPSVDTPSPEDLYMVGTPTKIIQMVKLPEGGVKILVEGVARVKIVEYFREEGHLKGKVEEMREFYERTIIVDALVQSVIALFKVALAIGMPLPVDVLKLIDKIENPARLADLIAVYLALKMDEQQDILETVDPVERIKKVFVFLSREVQTLQVRGKIQADVAKEMGKSQ